MSLDPNQREELLKKLSLTQSRELDCDEFSARLAEFVEGKPLEGDLQPLMRAHQLLCPECAEELQILMRALGRNPT